MADSNEPVFDPAAGRLAHARRAARRLEHVTERPRLLRPSARALDAVLHRDVGAVLVLRASARSSSSSCPPRSRDGGFGFDAAQASAIVGIYAACVYLASLPGGWVADRWLGLRRAIWWGGVLIAVGHLSHRAVARRSPQQGLLPRPHPHRDRHRAAQAEHLGDRRRSLPRGRRAARRRLLDLLHGDQHRRLHRAAHHRLPRRAGRLALGLRRGRRRDARRPAHLPCARRRDARTHRHRPAVRHRRRRSGRSAPSRSASPPWSALVVALAMAGVFTIDPLAIAEHDDERSSSRWR